MLPEQDSVAHFFVQIAAILFQWQKMRKLIKSAQIGVDPLREGPLFLFEYCVKTVSLLTFKM